MLSLGIGVNGRKNVSLYDANALAFINATGLTGTTEKTAVNNLVKNLKSYGLWSKMKAIYPFVSDTVNLLSYTEDFSNIYWNKGNTTVTTNSTTAPDGTTTADSIIPNTSNGGHSIYVGGLISGSQVITCTIYAKAKGYNYIGLSDATTGQAVFDLSNGTLVSQDSGITASTPVSAGNGWYRCQIKFTASTNRGIGVDVWNNSTKTLYAGNNIDGVYLWGAQLEVSATASTYQPIATTPANRFVSQFKYNLKDARDLDAAFRLSFNGTWTYSKQGATPNGVNGYVNTYLNQSTVLSANNLHLSYYSRTSTTANDCIEIGVNNSSGASYNPQYSLTIRNNTGNSTSTVMGDYNTNFAKVTNLTTSAYYGIGTRTSSTSSKLYKNGIVIATDSSTNSTSANNYTIYIGASNNGGGSGFQFSSKQTAFSTIGDGLTDTEATNLYTAVQKYQTSLSRQV